MSTITGADAIRQSLPQIPIEPPKSKSKSDTDDYPTLSSSGHSTTNARLPKTIIAFPADTFQDCLKSSALKKALNVQLNVVETESSHKLTSEGDIERASALYLVHHINRIVEKGLLPAIGITADRFSCVGQYTTGNSRPDIKFVVKGETVLILEYKRANALRERDWIDEALITPTRKAADVIKGMKKPGQRSALTDNAGVISLQASKYSSQCGLIVLFDYKNMIVLDFTPKNKPFEDEENPVQFLWSSGNPLTHKQLLIAALVYGLKKAKFMKSNA